jgi:malate dehydrogenase
VKLSEEEEKMFAKSVKLIRDTTENVCAVLDSESQE